MKRIKSFLTIIMATIFALSLVPVGAIAQDDTIVVNPSGANSTYKEGRSPAIRGTITLANTKKNETYNVWRMFELASFADENPATQQHGAYDTQEAYSYLIKETASGTPSWYTFLTTYGPKGNTNVAINTDNPPFAVMSNNASLLKNDKLDETKVTASGAYFVIDAEAVKFNGVDDYHAVRATENFSNAWDTKDSTSIRTDPDGTVPTNGDNTGNPDYSTAPTSTNGSLPNYDRIQDFAQAAVKYGTDYISALTPNYIETGIGDSLASTPTSGSLVVNDAQTGATGADYLNDVDNRNNGHVPLGYYLVGTTMGTLAALDTTNDAVSIYEKNDEPKIEKKVLNKESAAGAETVSQLTGSANWVENTDGDVGDYVQFRTVVTAQQGAKDYKLHDVMEKGLSFVNLTLTTANASAPNAGTTAADRYKDPKDSTKLYGAGDAKDYYLKVYLVRDSNGDGQDDAIWSIRSTDQIGGNGSTRTNWTLTAPSSSDECDFEIAFSDADNKGYDGTYEVAFAGRPYTNPTASPSEGAASSCEWVYVKDGDKIVVTYWAQITEDAVIYGTDAEAGDLSTIEDNKSNDLAAAYQQKTGSDGNQRNTNATVLCYGDRSHTVKDTADVTVYQFDVAKTNESRQSDDTDWEALAGAKFQIFKAKVADGGDIPEGALDSTNYVKESANALVFEKSASGNSYLYKGDKVVTTDGITPTTSGNSIVNELESATDNPINLCGLESGVYLLYETEAPMGYNKLAHPIVIKINPDDNNDGAVPGTDNPLEGTINYQTQLNSGNVQTASTNKAWDATYKQGADGATYKYPTNAVEDDSTTTTVDETIRNGGVHIVNQTGQELPSTGGVGTTVFYVAGTVLVVGAVVMLVAKRRMGSEA